MIFSFSLLWKNRIGYRASGNFNMDVLKLLFHRSPEVVLLCNIAQLEFWRERTEFPLTDTEIPNVNGNAVGSTEEWCGTNAVVC